MSRTHLLSDRYQSNNQANYFRKKEATTQIGHRFLSHLLSLHIMIQLMTIKLSVLVTTVIDERHFFE